MNVVSELINNRRKLVREVACLATEGRLFQRTASLCTIIAEAIFVIVRTWQGNSSKLTIRIVQIVRRNHVTPLDEFRGQIIGCKDL